VRRLARIAHRLRAEDGLTLPEMMIVVLLLGIVMAFALQSVATFQTSATGGIRRLENLEEGRLLMQVVTKDIRTAVRMDTTVAPFLVADDNEVTFYANLNLTTACPKKVRIYVDGSSRLIEAIWEPTGGTPPSSCTYGAYPGSPTRTRFVGRYVANTASEPIFTYFYDNAGTLTAYATSATPLSAANALLVKAVQVQLSIRKGTTLQVDRTTIVNTVRLPNVYYNPLPSPS
jgi:prepilin-type N-terminal cleavage/methylation domain-containing protein